MKKWAILNTKQEFTELIVENLKHLFFKFKLYISIQLLDTTNN